MQVKFGGYDHNLGADEGSIWDMENMCGDLSPMLSPRPSRTKIRPLTTPNGIAAKDGLFWVDGTDFYYDGVKKGTVSNGLKTFCALGAYMVVFPDKKYYNTVTDEFGSLEATWTGTASFQDGTYAGESAAGNSTVKSISKTAISGGSGVSSVSSVGQIESRNSRDTADVRFIAL